MRIAVRDLIADTYPGLCYCSEVPITDIALTYSMTSSARATTKFGMVRFNAFAACKLTTNSKRDGRWAGKRRRRRRVPQDDYAGKTGYGLL